MTQPDSRFGHWSEANAHIAALEARVARLRDALMQARAVGDKLRSLDMEWPAPEAPVAERNAAFQARVAVWAEWTDARYAIHQALEEGG